MKYRTMVMMMGVATVLLCSSSVVAQDNLSEIRQNEKDSVQAATLREEREQTTRDEDRMADAKWDRKQTKAKAKNASRIEKDASDAARQSRQALRAERRAQKARKQADKQEQKALKAREKSNRN